MSSYSTDNILINENNPATQATNGIIFGTSGTSKITSTAGTIQIVTSGQSQLHIGSNGYVGIGTTTPQAVLDINGNVIIEALKQQTNSYLQVDTIGNLFTSPILPITTISANTPLVSTTNTTTGITNISLQSSSASPGAYNTPLSLTTDQHGLITQISNNPYVDFINSNTYSIGTISCSGTNIATGFGTTFFAAMTGGVLIVNNTSFIITGVTSATSITLSRIGAFNSSYTIYYGKTYIDYDGSVSVATKLYLGGQLCDSTYNPGVLGQVLESTGSGTIWSTLSGVSPISVTGTQISLGYTGITPGTYNTPMSITADVYGLLTNAQELAYIDLVQSSQFSFSSITISGNVVTGGGSSFTSNLVGGVLVFSNQAAIITGYVSPSQLTISKSYTYSGLYTIYHGKTYVDLQGSLSTNQPLYLGSGLYDSTYSLGTAGQVLESTGSRTVWTTPSTGSSIIAQTPILASTTSGITTISLANTVLFQGGNAFGSEYIYGSLDTQNVKLLTGGIAVLESYPSGNISYSPTGADPGIKLYYNITNTQTSSLSGTQLYSLTTGNDSTATTIKHLGYITSYTPTSFSGIYEPYIYESILSSGTITGSCNNISNITQLNGVSITGNYTNSLNFVHGNSNTASFGSIYSSKIVYSGSGIVSTLYGQYISLNHTSNVAIQAFIYLDILGNTPTTSYGIYQNNVAQNVFGGPMTVGGLVAPTNSLYVASGTIQVASFGSGYVVSSASGILSSIPGMPITNITYAPISSPVIPNTVGGTTTLTFNNSGVTAGIYSTPMTIAVNQLGLITNATNDTYVDLVQSTQYSIGTISITNSTVTGTGFSSNMVGGVLVLPTGSAIIIQFTSATQLTLDTSTYTGYSGSYAIYYGKTYVDYQGYLSTAGLYMGGPLYDSVYSPGATGQILQSNSGKPIWTSPYISSVSASLPIVASVTGGVLALSSPTSLVQGGNAFGAPYIYGSLDANQVSLVANNIPAIVAFPSQNILFAPTSTAAVDPGYLLSFNYAKPITGNYIAQNYVFDGFGVLTGTEYFGHSNIISFGLTSGSTTSAFFTGSNTTATINNGISSGVYGTISTAITNGHTSGFISAFQNTCNANNSSLISNGYGCRCFVVANNSSTITSGYGLDVEYSTDSTSTIGTLYQVYLGVRPVGAVIGTDYGFYQDNIAMNILKGNTVIAGSVNPTHSLEIQSGTIQVQSFGAGYVLSSSLGVLSSVPGTPITSITATTPILASTTLGATTLAFANSGVVAGTYTTPMSIAVSALGLITSATDNTYIDLVQSTQYLAGTVSISGTTVTGTGTTFTSGMVGGVITFPAGSAIITHFTSTTQLTIDFGYTYSGSYVIYYGKTYVDLQGSLSTQSLYLGGALYDSTYSLGTVGQILESTGSNTSWVSPYISSVSATLPILASVASGVLSLSSPTSLVQNGNTFGAPYVFGSLDVNQVNLITNGSPAMIAFPSQNVLFGSNSGDSGTKFSVIYSNAPTTNYTCSQILYSASGALTGLNLINFLTLATFTPTQATGSTFTGSSNKLEITGFSSTNIVATLNEASLIGHTATNVYSSHNQCITGGTTSVQNMYLNMSDIQLFATATVTNAYGFITNCALVSPSTITNYYQYYMGTLPTSGITNSYGIYQSNTAQNILLGNTAIAGSVNPTHSLEVQSGTIQVQSFAPATQGYVVSSNIGVLSAAPSLTAGTFSPAAVTVTNGIITSVAAASASGFTYAFIESATMVSGTGFAPQNIIVTGLTATYSSASGVTVPSTSTISLAPGKYSITTSYIMIAPNAGVPITWIYNVNYVIVSGSATFTNNSAYNLSSYQGGAATVPTSFLCYVNVASTTVLNLNAYTNNSASNSLTASFTQFSIGITPLP